MKSTLFRKLFTISLSIIVIFGILAVLLSYPLIKQKQMDSSISELKHIAACIKIIIEEKDADSLENSLLSMDNLTNRRITVIRNDGMVLADTRASTESMDNHITRPEIQMALNSGFGVSVRYSKTIGKNMIYAAVSYSVQDGSEGVVRVSMPEEDFNSLMKGLYTKLGITALILIAFSMLLGYLLTRSIARPLQQLSDASTRVGKGDFSTVIMHSGTTEIDRLANSFNMMVTEINRLFSELNINRQLLNSVLESTQEAMCVINRDDDIVLHNVRFSSMFGNEAIGRKYWNILKHHSITELIKNTKKTGNTNSAEMEIDGEWFSIYITKIGESGDMLLSLYNFTEIKNLQIVKKDFVTNVSHELRTPLTAIKGFLETIGDNADNETMHYLNIIQRHTERLIHIVNDLLVLSETESGSFTLHRERVNIPAFIKSELNIFRRMSEEKGIALEFHSDNENMYADIDAFAMEQVFINLIENALKYTEKGKVDIFVKSDNENIIIDIADTGPGIPQEHLARIFERFYVVDKSRTRETGGTGLGLSIVKHIVLLHEGRIDVKSEIGKGSTFTVKLAKSVS